MLRPHGLHCRQLALAVGHLNGEDALAAAVLLRIVGDRSSFAKAVLGDDKEVARTVGNLHAQDTCAVFHSDAAHTAGIAAGGTHLILAENDSLARGRRHDDLVALAHAANVEQRIAIF